MINNSIKIIIAGDFVPPNGDIKIYSDELISFLKDKDYSLVNLEVPLTNCTNPILKTGSNLKRRTDSISYIKEGFFDAVTLSNNHIRDFGDQGVLDTLQVCELNGIKFVGAGKDKQYSELPLIIDIKGGKIAFINYSEQEFNCAGVNQAGANCYDAINAFYEIKKAKQENDYVFIIYHGGVEYSKYPSPRMVNQFKYIIDNGADAVIVHHSHYYSGIIEYNNKPIFCGLGNFYINYVNYKDPPDDTRKGIIITLTLNNKRLNYSFVPVIQDPVSKKLGIAPNSIKRLIEEEIFNISKVLIDETKFELTWEACVNKDINQLLDFIKSSTKAEYSIRKHLPLFSRKVSKFKLLSILNFLRCDSHRYKHISIIEHILKENWE